MKWIKKGNKVEISAREVLLEVSFPAIGGIRLAFGPDGPKKAWSPVLNGEPELLDIQVREETDGLTVKSGALELMFTGDESLQVRKDGAECFAAPAHAFLVTEDVVCFQFNSPPEDRIYGLGQDPAARLDHNHQERRMWNQWGGHERSGNNGIGFFSSTGGYGMLLATPADARFGFNENDPQPLDPLGEAMVPSLWAEAVPRSLGTGCVEVRGAADVFLLFGTPEEVLKDYYHLTGFPGLLPKWSYGFIQCKNRYMNQEDLLAAARRIRKLGIPCDGLVIDWLWFEEFGDLEWRKDDWPEPEEMLRQLSALGYSVVSAQHPFISEKGKYYAQYVKEGYLNSVPETKRITYDHTNPRARAHWWEKTARLYRQGLRGYWTDMGELEEHFDGSISAAGGRTKTHNAYSLLWAKGLQEGQREEFGTRAFILSRAACAGIQKYGTAMWSGDINATWQVLKDQVVLAQTMAMSGMPWWGTDIGGFLSGSECTPELYVRWMEWGVFCGLFRTHGTRPGNEPDSFGEEAREQIRKLIRLRYTLLPYIYSLAMRCALEGTSIITPLACAFFEDAVAASCQGQYMFGPSLLVAPITEPGARSGRVYLPEGTWYHWWSGKQYTAGWHTVPAPLGQIPLFVRAGALIPIYTVVGRNVQDCGGLALLRVPGGKGAFDYYDDAGDGFGYKEGRYTHVRFEQSGGSIRAVAYAGEVPEYCVVEFGARAGEAAVAVDTQWQGDRASITLTFLKAGSYHVDVTPGEGWYVNHCTQGGCGWDMEEPAYLNGWQGELVALAGEKICWQLYHTELMRRIGVQTAQITLKGQDGECHTLTARWDGPFLSDPSILGCLPPGASERGFSPEQAPALPEYSFDGKYYRWTKDPLFAHNCFGYVEFRRLDPERRGEAMLGEAWARENLYSKIAQNVEFELRYDSPITLWLNGEEIYCGREKNARDISLTLPLKAGKNMLIIRQIADIPRPYSGGENGYSLKLAGMHKIYSIK